MRIVVSMLAILFGLLHFIAGLTQFKSQDPAVRGSTVMMACGGIAVACAAISHLGGAHPMGWVDALSAVPGGLLICSAAYLNGKRSGNFHLSHHIIRGGIAVLLVVGFILW